MLKFTVFTPVRNRRHTIHRVWQSLNNQTFRDFEWIIVDNESEDNVLPLLNEYKEKADFDVIIFSHKNRGLHFSLNKGFQLANGELYVRIDSDDEMVPEALARYNHWWDYVKNNYDYTKISGINVLCKDQSGQILGTKYPQHLGLSNSLELKYKIKSTGEKWGCVRTDLLKQMMFPEDKETYGVYIPDSYIWFQLAKKYNFLCVNEVLRIYHVGAEDQITNTQTKNVLKGVDGRFVFVLFKFNNVSSYLLKNNKKALIKEGLNFWRIGLRTKYSLPEIFAKIKNYKLKIFAFLLLGPSIVFFNLFRRKFYIF